MLYDVVDLGDDEVRIRAIALQAAAVTYAGKASGNYVVRQAQLFEKYLRTGQIR